MALTIVQAGMGGTGSTTASSTGTGAAVLATQPSFPSTIGVGGATAAASGAGITFPATQSASSNANTLDDYEEGTWTPVDGSGAGLTLTVITAAYTKIGKMVYASCAVTYPSTANGNQAQIGGLPFVTCDQPGGYWGGYYRYCDRSTVALIANNPGNSSLDFYAFGGGAVSNANLSGTRHDVVIVYSI